MWGDGKDLPRAEATLDEASRLFKIARDGFGIATTRCNLGVVKAYLGDLAAAEKLFRKSFDELSIFGTQHIEESGTNLGTILLLRGRDDEARRHLAKLLSVIEMDFPRALAECTMAVLELRGGQPRIAQDRIRRLTARVDKDVRMREASTRVRLTAALVESLTNDDPEVGRRLVAEAAEYSPEAPELLKIEDVVTKGTATVENLRDLYPHEYLQYWSQNPLKVLPAEALTAQTIFHDVA
jgi:tetratricopeptide (TPR) repeat protein